MALAAQATTRLRLGTSVAMAFPRSPTVTAMSAWTLAKLSKGRFILGLGPQVRAHIERRYGLSWSPAGPWMREYVQAVRAVWAHWQTGAKLDVQGPHYNINLMVPLFNPGPIEHPDIPIHLAAVNSVMCRTAGEVAEGIRLHPVCTPSYIEKVMLPAGREGAARMGRNAKTSVLNGFNQVWDAPNVFVTDGACMTSSACQNPSLTYMALTARAARFAVEELKRGNL